MIDIIVSLEDEFANPVSVDDVAAALSVKLG
jgi:hypothetical protein